MIILDCSAAIEICRRTDLGQGFEALMLASEKVLAPEILKVEVRNAIWKYVRFGALGKADAQGQIETALSLVDEFVPTDENVDEAYAEAVLREHPVYDMLYATLARRHACTLFTADRKLANLCIEMGVNAVCELKLSELPEEDPWQG